MARQDFVRSNAFVKKCCKANVRIMVRRLFRRCRNNGNPRSFGVESKH